jgi:hypothetical protein
MVYIMAFLIVNKKVNNFIRDYNKCINIKKRKRIELLVRLLFELCFLILRFFI